MREAASWCDEISGHEGNAERLASADRYAWCSLNSASLAGAANAQNHWSLRSPELSMQDLSFASRLSAMCRSGVPSIVHDTADVRAAIAA